MPERQWQTRVCCLHAACVAGCVRAPDARACVESLIETCV
jgi:hypothetical protein